MTHAMATTQSEQEMDKCARQCGECQDECERTIQHCLEMGGPHAAADHIRLMMDCAQICATSHDFMTRRSDLHGHTCAACAAVCEACAADCERLAGGDEAMKRCAETCRRCAEMCRKMSA